MENTKITNAEKTRIVKKAIKDAIKPTTISVVGGRGTATGWIDARVEVQADHTDHTGEDLEIGLPCNKCLDQRRNLVDLAKEVSRKALKDNGTSFYTYWDDMNFEHEEFLLSLRIVK